MAFSFFRKPAKPTTFAENQEWRYKTRAGEERSTVIINKVESHPKLGNIYHVSVKNVKVKNAHVRAGFETVLPHSPVSTKTLEQSLTEYVGHSKPNPDYIDGYNEWKSAFDQGVAGIFTVTIAEIVDVVERAISHAQ